MNSVEKYLQHGVLASDENVSSLWELLHQEPHDIIAIPGISKTETLTEYREIDFESADDFIEVWMSIEESIRIFENQNAKHKEEQTDILN
jgi:hypothetical protein